MTALGNKQVMADNLLYYMQKNNVDRYKLCQDLNFKYSTVCEWLSAHKYPRIDSIEKMANYFNVPKSALIERRTETNLYSSGIPDHIYMIPVFDSVSAGFGALAEDYIVDYMPAEIRCGSEAGNYIYINVKGDSMINARICDGDIVFIREQTMVDDGEIAAVVIDDEATLKRVYYDRDNAKLVLQAENPKYCPLVYVGEELNTIHILGKAVAFESDL